MTTTTQVTCETSHDPETGDVNTYYVIRDANGTHVDQYGSGSMAQYASELINTGAPVRPAREAAEARYTW